MALFFLKTSSSDKSFLVQGILMIVLMVITLATQLFLKQAFDRTFPPLCLLSTLLSRVDSSRFALPTHVTRHRASTKEDGTTLEKEPR